MAAKNKCLICGTEYEVCKFCPKTVEYTPWRQVCDTPTHFQVYTICKDLQGNTITPEEARKLLVNLGVTEAEVKTFVAPVQEILAPVFKVGTVESKPEVQSVKKRTTKKAYSVEGKTEDTEDK